MMRGARRLFRAPRRAASQVVEGIANIGAATLTGIRSPAPESPFNVEIGPHRRYTYLDADLAQFKAIKDSLGGTLNDVVLAVVSLALGRYLRDQLSFRTDDVELKAMVPVSVGAVSVRSALGHERRARRWP